MQEGSQGRDALKEPEGAKVKRYLKGVWEVRGDYSEGSINEKQGLRNLLTQLQRQEEMF